MEGVRQGCPLSPTLFKHLLGRFNEELFPEHGGFNIGGRKIKGIIFANDMALLAENERMLKNMLMELNDRCEDFGMNININKTKIMVIGRKPKEIDIRIKHESVEQVDCFKYLGCNIRSNLNCCQEIKQRTAMTKEAFNSKKSIFCGPLEKELTKSLVKCFVWNVALYDLGTTTE